LIVFRSVDAVLALVSKAVSMIREVFAPDDPLVAQGALTSVAYADKSEALIRTFERDPGIRNLYRAALEALPGVGRKTANVVLNIAFGEPTIAVDTHLFRVGNRTGLAPGKTPLEVENKLSEVVPKRMRRHAHHWLIPHGRYVCLARKPKCPECVVEDLCRFEGKTTF